MLLPLPRPRRAPSCEVHTPAPSAEHTAPTGSPSAAVERLRPLLEAAAQLDLQDAAGWSRLTEAARGRMGVLIAGGHLPSHLSVGPGDPPVVVTRSIAAAWQHLTNRADRCR